MKSTRLTTGKLPHRLLGSLLDRHVKPLLEAQPSLAKRVRVGPVPGEDAAVVLPPDGDAIVITSDPITFVSDELGWYVVQVNANDIAAMGGEPEFLVLVVLIPEDGAESVDVERLFAEAVAACRELGVALIGGHTEITPAVRQPVAVGQMLGRVPADSILSSSGARPGDDILVTKGFPVEGVAVMAELRKDEVLQAFGEEFLGRCLGFAKEPGISVVNDSRVVREAAIHMGIHLGAMHDPTEGGLATALWEVAEASGVGLEVKEEVLPLLPEGEKLCDLLGLNPFGVIASGSLLVTCKDGRGRDLAEKVSSEGVPCRVIGNITSQKGKLFLLRGEDVLELPRFDSDEVTRLL
jgi:hydrogenase maturation factor